MDNLLIISEIYYPDQLGSLLKLSKNDEFKISTFLNNNTVNERVQCLISSLNELIVMFAVNPLW